MHHSSKLLIAKINCFVKAYTAEFIARNFFYNSFAFSVNEMTIISPAIQLTYPIKSKKNMIRSESFFYVIFTVFATSRVFRP